MYQPPTIVAISTPHGEGAIGVIRLSGPDAIKVVDGHTAKNLNAQAANEAVFHRFRVGDNVLDEVLITIFKAPHSYTGEDLAEISFHGSNYVLQSAMQALIDSGAAIAEPGDFTKRAFLNGKMDLSQAEAVADLIASESEAEHRLAMHQMRGGFSNEIAKLREELINFASLIELELDFAEEDVEFANRDQLKALIEKIQGFIHSLIDSFRFGNAIKSGVPVAIIGKPNVGKSTLLNVLLNEDRAIVSEIAGTTRDTVEDTFVIDGVRFRFIDTAGLRDTEDTIEAIGVKRSLEKMKTASIVVYMYMMDDPSSEVEAEIELLRTQVNSATAFMVVGNKIDQSAKAGKADLFISAKTGEGIDVLRHRLVEFVHNGLTSSSNTVVTNTRHLQALKATDTALIDATNGIDSGMSGDLVSSDIRQALHHLGSITGEISTEDLLGNIFGKFCIGK